MSETIQEITAEALTSETLTGKFLIAMPTLSDPRFDASVIYICAHSFEGAMGLIINKVSSNIEAEDVFEQLDVTRSADMQPLPVHYGGPVEMGRGFVLHSVEEGDMRADDPEEASMQVSARVAMTASRDILKDIAAGQGPQERLLCLGYAGWEPDQLETEIKENAWLTCDADFDILFNTDAADIWDAALQSMGVKPALLSGEFGRA